IAQLACHLNSLKRKQIRNTTHSSRSQTRSSRLVGGGFCCSERLSYTIHRATHIKLKPRRWGATASAGLARFRCSGEHFATSFGIESTAFLRLANDRRLAKPCGQSAADSESPRSPPHWHLGVSADQAHLVA